MAELFSSPRPLSSTCTALIVRRFSNPMVMDTAKYFKTEISTPTPNFIGLFKTLCKSDPLSESEYKTASSGSDLSKLAYFNDICVGCIVADNTGIKRLAVLDAYKGLGVEEVLVEHLKGVEGVQRDLESLKL